MDIVDRVVYMQDGRIASDMEAAAFKALPEADIRRMGLRVRDLSVSESGGVKTIAADGLLSVQKISVRLGGRNVLNNLSFRQAAEKSSPLRVSTVPGNRPSPKCSADCKRTAPALFCGLENR